MNHHQIPLDNFVWWPHKGPDGVIWIGAEADLVDEVSGPSRRIKIPHKELCHTVHLDNKEMAKFISSGSQGTAYRCHWCGSVKIEKWNFCSKCGRKWNHE